MIEELVHIVADVVNYAGIFEYDASKPDGAQRILLEVPLLSSLGWRERTTFPDRNRLTYECVFVHSSERVNTYTATARVRANSL